MTETVATAAKRLLESRYDPDGFFSWRVPGERIEALARAVTAAEERHRQASRASARRRRPQATPEQRAARRAYSRAWMRKKRAAPQQEGPEPRA